MLMRSLEIAGRRALGDPKVEHPDLAIARDEHVFWLDISVDDAFVVCGCEHVEELICHGEHLAGIELAASTLSPAIERLALEQVHNEVHGAVLGGVIIDDRHRTRMGDLVGYITLTQKSAFDVCVDRELPVEHFDRHAFAVAVRCRENGCHAPHAEEGIQVPLFSEDFADLRTGLRRHVVARVVRRRVVHGGELPPMGVVQEDHDRWVYRNGKASQSGRAWRMNKRTGLRALGAA
jgi:hypothetical protein